MTSSTPSANGKALGRPPKRTHVMSFRVSDEEAARIASAASGLRRPRTAGDACRALALKWAMDRVPDPVPPRRAPPRRKPAADVEMLARLLGQLGKLGSNVNQLARQANTHGRLPETKVLLRLANDVDALKRSLQLALVGGNDGDQGE